ncbi:MAG: hypothetical protein RLY16_1363 [Bacteroidota bacterium]
MHASLFHLEDQALIPHNRNNDENYQQAQLVIALASEQSYFTQQQIEKLHAHFSAAQIVYSSTAGEIYQEFIIEDTLMVIALRFEKTNIATACVNIGELKNSYNAAKQLAELLPKDALKHIMIFSDGNQVNGSQLVKGLNEATQGLVKITGGLAGDGARFEKTLVGLNELPKEGNIAAIGFYGDSIQITHGVHGGWEPFGPERIITHSTENKLLEIDDKNALDLYKNYLGDDVKHLPASALLYPLSISMPDSSYPLVRTILRINEEEKSMVFAGELPVGSKVRLMKSNSSSITTAAALAVQSILEGGATSPEFVFVVSCIGRKLMLGNRAEEELETINQNFPGTTVIAGYYSYGEIAPFPNEKNCQLHNQTITLTSFYEI